jgi:hypothetical protein
VSSYVPRWIARPNGGAEGAKRAFGTSGTPHDTQKEPQHTAAQGMPCQNPDPESESWHGETRVDGRAKSAESEPGAEVPRSWWCACGASIVARVTCCPWCSGMVDRYRAASIVEGPVGDASVGAIEEAAATEPMTRIGPGQDRSAYPVLSGDGIPGPACHRRAS